MNHSVGLLLLLIASASLFSKCSADHTIDKRNVNAPSNDVENEETAEYNSEEEEYADNIPGTEPESENYVAGHDTQGNTALENIAIAALLAALGGALPGVVGGAVGGASSMFNQIRGTASSSGDAVENQDVSNVLTDKTGNDDSLSVNQGNSASNVDDRDESAADSPKETLPSNVAKSDESSTNKPNSRTRKPARTRRTRRPRRTPSRRKVNRKKRPSNGRSNRQKSTRNTKRRGTRLKRNAEFEDVAEGEYNGDGDDADVEPENPLATVQQGTDMGFQVAEGLHGLKNEDKTDKSDDQSKSAAKKRSDELRKERRRKSKMMKRARTKAKVAARVRGQASAIKKSQKAALKLGKAGGFAKKGSKYLKRVLKRKRGKREAIEKPESTNEEPESINEEPESINEEPESTNEKPESTNEEPESTNEKPESTNEEPESTNEEPESTIEEPGSTNGGPKSTNEELIYEYNDYVDSDELLKQHEQADRLVELESLLENNPDNAVDIRTEYTTLRNGFCASLQIKNSIEGYKQARIANLKENIGESQDFMSPMDNEELDCLLNPSGNKYTENMKSMNVLDHVKVGADVVGNAISNVGNSIAGWFGK